MSFMSDDIPTIDTPAKNLPEERVPLSVEPSPSELPSEAPVPTPKPTAPAEGNETSAQTGAEKEAAHIAKDVAETSSDSDAKKTADERTSKSSVAPPAKKDPFATFHKLFFRLSVKDKMLFARHMEMMTRSGLQVLEALEILRKQTQKPAFSTVLDHMIADVKNGHYLSVAMERYRKVFGDFVINLVRVGETSGTLSDNFKYLAQELEKKAELNKKVIGALIYPIVILVATFGITGIMVFLIFPRILPVLRSLNVELPLATRVFIFLSELIINNGLWIFLGLVALVIGWFLLLRIPAFRFRINATLLKLPLIGPLITDVNIITMARTMNLMLKGGVQIVEALEISRKSLNNVVYQQQLGEIGLAVQRGDRMSKLMIERRHLFPATFAEMSNVGESTGKLDETLEFLAEFYEDELDGATKTLSNVLEPMLLLAMGLIVSFVAISIITPIYKISQSLGR